MTLRDLAKVTDNQVRIYEEKGNKPFYEGYLYLDSENKKDYRVSKRFKEFMNANGDREVIELEIEWEEVWTDTYDYYLAITLE